AIATDLKSNVIAGRLPAEPARALLDGTEDVTDFRLGPGAPRPVDEKGNQRDPAVERERRLYLGILRRRHPVGQGNEPAVGGTRLVGDPGTPVIGLGIHLRGVRFLTMKRLGCPVQQAASYRTDLRGRNGELTRAKASAWCRGMGRRRVRVSEPPC